MPNRPRATLALVAHLIAAICAPLAAQDRSVALRSYFTELAAKEGFSGGVLVTEQGRTVYQGVFGAANLATGQPNRAELPFPIASISKTFMAVAILQQEERGALSISDPVAKLLPGWPYPAITVRHLLSHSSGLPPYNAWFDSVRAGDSSRMITNADFLPAVIARPIPLRYQPGVRGSYDNVNYIVLALILERVTGQPFERYIRQHILDPAGMRQTRSFPLWQQFAKPEKGVVEPHLFPHRYSAAPELASTYPYIRQYWIGYRLGGFGDYVSTLSDMQHYAAALTGGRLLHRATLDRVQTLVLLNNGQPTPGRFGLGFELQADTTHGLVFGHSGFSVGLNSILLINPSKRQVVIAYNNTGNLGSMAGRHALAILNSDTVPRPQRSWATRLGQRLAASSADTMFTLATDTVGYKVSEDEINEMGYDFMGMRNPYRLPVVQRLPEALFVFRLNTTLFPAGWNTWDSYAEALAASGRREEAIQHYRKSLELNPDNANGKEMLERLLNEQS